ncbi:MAG: thiol reductase thioredoxin [Mycoplasma sp.]|nr:thiol reductase thioredoxin [Mycoplasma sp.]
MSKKRLKEVNKEIKELEKELKNVEGTEAEVYTRIVGYFRDVSKWNKGKKEEFKERVLFDVDSKPKKEKATKNSISLMFFHGKVCPNCFPVEEYLEDKELEVFKVDVGDEEGFEMAKKYDVRKTPTVILLDKENNEIKRCFSVKELKDAL